MLSQNGVSSPSTAQAVSDMVDGVLPAVFSLLLEMANTPYVQYDAYIDLFVCYLVLGS